MIKSIFINLSKYFTPKSKYPDVYRRELILNSLLFLFLGLLSSFLILTIYSEIHSNSHIGSIQFGILLIPFMFSYYLSRQGYIILASSILISIFTFGTWLAIFKWDIRLPAAMLSLVLSTTIVGNLFTSKIGFMYASVSALLVFLFSHLTTNGYILTDLSWQSASIRYPDALEIGIFLLFTSGVAWISNQQTDISLKRAKNSELAL